jgi:hypothetical protein
LGLYKLRCGAFEKQIPPEKYTLFAVQGISDNAPVVNIHLKREV